MAHISNASIYSLYRNAKNQLQLCQVAVSISNGLNGCQIIGGVDKTIKEAYFRVKAAIKASDFRYPPGKIVVNLSPLAAAKKGSCFDLAIALALLKASKQIKLPAVCLAYGELSLAGSLIEPSNLLSDADLDLDSKQLKALVTSLRQLCPSETIVCLGPDLDKTGRITCNVLCLLAKFQKISVKTEAISNLKDFNLLKFADAKLNANGMSLPVPYMLDVEISSKLASSIDREELLAELAARSKIALQTYSALRNIAFCKEVFKLALAGGHSLALIGSNGSGKTELLHSAIYFLANEIKAQIERKQSNLIELNNYVLDLDFMTLPSKLLNYKLQTGKLWHLQNGLIFLSELNKFRTKSLLCLEQFFKQQIDLSQNCKQQQIMQADQLNISPHCQMLVDFNPCPCGNLFEPWLTACSCSNFQIKQFNRRLTGAIWDRLALICIARRITAEETKGENMQVQSNGKEEKLEESASQVKYQIEQCRKWQRERNGKTCMHACLNSQLTLAELNTVQLLSNDMHDFLHLMRLSRHYSYRRLYFVRTTALTLADLACEKCQLKHFLQASNYCSVPEEFNYA